MSEHITTLHTAPSLVATIGENTLVIRTFCGPADLEDTKGIETRRCVLLQVNGESIALNNLQVKHLSVLLGDIAEV